MFTTAIVGFADAVTADEVLKTAVGAITSGADAIITSRGFDTVRMLADELIPVMGHLGFAPRKSTWVGGVRPAGKTAAEALELWDRFRRLEDAGSFAVECELVPAAVMAEINRRTALVTVSLGSGAEADVIYLFTSDITGEATRLPRHARSWGRMGELQGAIREERRQALASFRMEVERGSYPSKAEQAHLPDEELDAFRESLNGCPVCKHWCRTCSRAVPALAPCSLKSVWSR